MLLNFSPNKNFYQVYRRVLNTRHSIVCSTQWRNFKFLRIRVKSKRLCRNKQVVFQFLTQWSGRQKLRGHNKNGLYKHFNSRGKWRDFQLSFRTLIMLSSGQPPDSKACHSPTRSHSNRSICFETMFKILELFLLVKFKLYCTRSTEHRTSRANTRPFNANQNNKYPRPKFRLSS